jgi:hypothetical protein
MAGRCGTLVAFNKPEFGSTMPLIRPHGPQRLDCARLPEFVRDWAAERTNFPGEVAEMALAHAVGE